MTPTPASLWPRDHSYLVRNYEWVAGALGLNVTEVARLARNSFQGSFIAEVGLYGLLFMSRTLVRH